MNYLKILQEVPVNSIFDERGSLDVAELSQLISFQTKRIYYISGVPQAETRGEHAHKSLRQIFFALSGSFTLKVSDGILTEEVIVNAHSDGYFLDSGYWRVLENFSPEALCLVLASEAYDANDYIHSFTEYKNWRKTL